MHRSRYKIVGVVVVVVLGSILILAGDARPGSPQSSTRTKARQDLPIQYVSPDGSFSITPPATWQVREYFGPLLCDCVQLGPSTAFGNAITVYLPYSPRALQLYELFIEKQHVEPKRRLRWGLDVAVFEGVTDGTQHGPAEGDFFVTEKGLGLLVLKRLTGVREPSLLEDLYPEYGRELAETLESIQLSVIDEEE